MKMDTIMYMGNRGQTLQAPLKKCLPIEHHVPNIVPGRQDSWRPHPIVQGQWQFPSRHPRRIGVQKDNITDLTVYRIPRHPRKAHRAAKHNAQCLGRMSNQNPKLPVDRSSRSQSDQITTKFRSDTAILHEIAWRSQWWRSRTLRGQQCHTSQRFTCCIVHITTKSLLSHA